MPFEIRNPASVSKRSNTMRVHGTESELTAHSQKSTWRHPIHPIIPPLAVNAVGLHPSAKVCLPCRRVMLRKNARKVLYLLRSGTAKTDKRGFCRFCRFASGGILKLSGDGRQLRQRSIVDAARMMGQVLAPIGGLFSVMESNRFERFIGN